MEIYYTIYQTEGKEYTFLPYNYAIKHGFDLLDYEQVANSMCNLIPEKGKTLNVSVTEILNSLWTIYSGTKPPKYYQSRPLMMSDIIILTAKAGDVYLELGTYYRDIFKWIKVD